MNKKSPAKYILRVLDPDDRQGVIDLLGNVFGGEARTTTTKVWDWKFTNHPHNSEAGPILLVITCRDEIVGFLGTAASRIKFGNEVVPAFWGTDLVTHARHRGCGTRLLRWMIHAEYLRGFLKLGTPLPRAHALETKIGCWDIDHFRNYKYLLKPARVLTRKSSKKYLAYPASVLVWWASLASTSLSRPSPHHQVSRHDDLVFDQAFDDLWERVSTDYDVIAVRDSTFLNWRFAQCPVRSYTTFVSRRVDQLSGYLVVDLEESQQLKYCHIVDFLVSKREPGVLDGLLKSAIEYAKAQDADMMTCSILPIQTMCDRALRRNGFIVTKKGLPVIQCPGIKGMVLTPTSDLFCTRADSDSEYM